MLIANFSSCLGYAKSTTTTKPTKTTTVPTTTTDTNSNTNSNPDTTTVSSEVVESTETSIEDGLDQLSAPKPLAPAPKPRVPAPNKPASLKPKPFRKLVKPAKQRPETTEQPPEDVTRPVRRPLAPKRPSPPPTRPPPPATRPPPTVETTTIAEAIQQVVDNYRQQDIVPQSQLSSAVLKTLEQDFEQKKNIFQQFVNFGEADSPFLPNAEVYASDWRAPPPIKDVAAPDLGGPVAERRGTTVDPTTERSSLPPTEEAKGETARFPAERNAEGGFRPIVH